MTNEEYIKLLEARIENLEIALENLTKTATLKNIANYQNQPNFRL